MSDAPKHYPMPTVDSHGVPWCSTKCPAYSGGYRVSRCTLKDSPITTGICLPSVEAMVLRVRSLEKFVADAAMEKK